MNGITKIETEEIKKVDEEIISYPSTEMVKTNTNLIEFPIFTLNKKVKKNTRYKYIFDKNENSYLLVSPPAVTKSKNSTIPGEIDQKLFYALTIILKKQGYKSPIFCSPNMILKEMDSKRVYTNKDIKEILEKLQKTSYEFKNCFITKGSKTESISNFNLITFQEINSEKDIKIPQEFQHLIEDKRTKTIYKIFFNELYLQSLHTFGSYLSYNRSVIESLLKKKTIAFTIYQFLVLKRAKHLNLKISFIALASRIPYKITSNNKYYAYKKIVEALKILQEKKLILCYKEIVENKIENNIFDISFVNRNNKIDYHPSQNEIEAIQQTNNYQIFDISDVPNIPDSILSLIPDEYKSSYLLSLIQKNLQQGTEIIEASIMKIDKIKWKNKNLNFMDKLKIVLEKKWATGDLTKRKEKATQTFDAEKERKKIKKQIFETMKNKETKVFLKKFLEKIGEEITYKEFKVFFENMELYKFGSDKIVFVAITETIKKHIKENFSAVITKVCKEILGKEIKCGIVAFSS